MPRPLLGCIADDFTGATDLANNLVRSGMRTIQTIGVPADGVAPGDTDAIVVALKSRTIAPVEAVAQSLAALRWLQAQGVQQIYFKYCSTFDSTPAGNIGPVTDALLEALGSKFTIACPAFPEAQRTIFKGHLFVGDQLLSDSGMRNHPLTPMTDANLVRVLQQQTTRKVGLVAYDVVARGAEAIRERFAVLQAEGVQIAVVDAISNADLQKIGPALAGMPLVTAGSGIAIGLAQNWRATGALPEASGAADSLPPPTGTSAVISGSCSIATNTQVKYFQQAGRPCFCIDPLALARGEDLDSVSNSAEQGRDPASAGSRPRTPRRGVPTQDSKQNVVSQALDWAAPLLARGPVLIYATAETQAVKEVQEQLGAARAGELVESALARIATGLVALGVRQLVVAGGETAGAVVQALGVTQLVIGPQIAPGVPWTSARSGAHTLHLALKSGNFGGADFFTKAFAQLHD